MEVHFLNRQSGWVVGGNQLLKTDDGGKTWNRQSLNGGDAYNLKRIQFVSPKTGWIAGESGARRERQVYLAKTIDGGNSWVSQNFDTQYPMQSFSLDDLHFFNDQLGFISGSEGGYKHAVMFSTKDGSNWNKINPKTNIGQLLVRVIERDKIVAVNRAAIYLSHDGGQNWIAGNSVTDRDLFDVLALDDKQVVAVGAKGTIVETKNGGLDWKAIQIKTKYDLTKVVKGPQNSVWAIGDSGTVVAKKRNKWAVLPISAKTNLTAIQFVSEKKGYISGDNSTLMVTTDGGRRWSNVTNLSSNQLMIQDIHFSDPKNGILYIYEEQEKRWPRYLLRTNDGGNSWVKTKRMYGPDPNIFNVHHGLTAFHFSPNNKGYATTHSGYYESDDYGENWNKLEVYPKTSHKYVDVEVMDDHTIILLDSFGYLYVNSGIEWQKTIVKATFPLNAFTFTSDKLGWIVGSGGYIWKVDLSIQD